MREQGTKFTIMMMDVRIGNKVDNLGLCRINTNSEKIAYSFYLKSVHETYLTRVLGRHIETLDNVCLVKDNRRPTEIPPEVLPPG